MTQLGQAQPSLNGSTTNLNQQPAAAEVAVKVAVRVRPLNNREKLHQHQPCVRIASESNQIVIGKDKLFTFDYVLAPKISQAELYEACVRNLVHSLFEGYNATVFAYGQTGSGKTYTISGNKTTGDEYGIIPRAVHTMFQIINQNGIGLGAALGGTLTNNLSPPGSAVTSHNRLPNAGSAPQKREYCVKVNFIEIYKEELKDLLDTSQKELQIREDESGNTLISGANEVICTTLEEVMACFDSGTGMRHTGSTLMNEHSSRSHSVFTVSIEQRWSDSAKSVRESAIYDLNNTNASNSYYLGAKFHFVDLAGSERVNRTGNVGDRFKESIHINSGLLALGNVISALSSGDSKKKATHIPYRDSKITRILKDSLGGNANTLMICCISPSSCNLDESLNAVKYASRARSIKNKPIVNMDPHTQKFVEMQSEIQALREELSRQRTALMLTVNTHNQQHQNGHDNMNYDEELKQLESRLQSTQLECDFYKKLVKEAYGRFKQLNGPNNSTNTTPAARKIVDEWLTMFEASKNKADFDVEDFIKQRITQLEAQLKQAQDDLKSDEEIFADKEKEISELKEKINELESKLSTANRCLEASLNKEKEQQELMLQLQIQLDKLMSSKKNESTNKATAADLALNKQNNDNLMRLSSNRTANNQSTGNGSNQPNAKQRAKTAPQSNPNLINNNQEQRKNRAVYSSPALFTLERFMQSFRARSQLLTETLEENDCVLQKEAYSNLSHDQLLADANDLIGGMNDAFVNDNKENNRDETDDDIDQQGKGFVRKGTFKVNKPKAKQPLTSITDFQRVDSRQNNTDLATGGHEQAKKLRDLSMNIRMKEELIKELVANSKFTNRINLQYQQKIELLEKENIQLKADIDEMQRNIHRLSPTIGKDATKVEIDLRKRLDLAQQKINELEAKNKESNKFLNTNLNSDKKINELELNLSKLRQQNEVLQKRVKDESERKAKLEKDLEREQQRLKDVEVRSEKQHQILKKKTEDLASAQRRLRIGSGSNTALNVDADQAATTTAVTTANKHWIEQEMEKIVQEKRQMEAFKEELIKREELVKKKELLIKEKHELESKKMRSSEKNRESLILIDEKLESLSNKRAHAAHQPASGLKELEEAHSHLLKQRKLIDDRLNKGDLLSAVEERRLIEIDEAIEALEIAIDYENDSIKEQENKLRNSVLFNNENNDEKIGENVLAKLGTVPYEESKYLLKKFFQRIIDLKETEHKRHLETSELQVQLDEQNRLVEQLKQALNASSNDLERRLQEQKSKSDKNQKLLTSQLNECNNKIALLEREISLYKEKLTKLKTSSSAKSSGHNSAENINDVNATGSGGGGSFYLKASNHPAHSNHSHSNNSLNDSAMTSTNDSVKTVKVSRRDLRRLTEDEVLKRSVKKDHESYDYLNTNGTSQK